MKRLTVSALTLCTFAFACTGADTQDLSGRDGGPRDGGGARDSGPAPRDGGPRDAGPGGRDAGEPDGSMMCDIPQDCVSCAADDTCCFFTINCQPGSICNVPDDSDYDPTEPSDVCIKVLCIDDMDCDPGEVCAPNGRCEVPGCQTDDDCGREVCRNGECTLPTDPANVLRCAIVGTHAVLTPGRTVRVAAVGFDRAGEVIPGLGFTFASSNTTAVTVSGAALSGGRMAGQSTVTASLGRLACDGEITATNHAPLQGQQIRVVVIDARTEAPIPNASVTLVAGGPTVATTDATGAASFIQGIVAATSVTASAPGHAVVSLVGPSTDNLVLALPPVAVTTSAGFRGSIDLSATRPGDMKIGIASGHLSSDILTIGRVPFSGSEEDVTIQAPQIGLDGTYSMPSGLVLGLGSSALTGGPERCHGSTVPSQGVGCYLARGRLGAGAGWTLSGQLRLSQVTALANELASLMEGDPVPPEALLLIARLGGTFHHGVRPFIPYEAVANVPRSPTGNVDCSNPDLVDYATQCRPDYASWPQIDLVAAQPQTIRSVVDVEALPGVDANACMDAMTVMAAARLEGRGVIPLGFGVGFDTLGEMETPDCRIRGATGPFGPGSPPLDDGQLPLTSAVRHHGLEDGDLLVLAIARATQGDRLGRSVRVQYVNRIETQSRVAQAFLTPPNAVVDKTNARVTYTTPSGIFTRAEIYGDGSAWIVYAPANTPQVGLPDVAAGRAILAGSSDAIVAHVESTVGFADLFDLSAPTHAHHSVDYATAFATASCSTTGGTTCSVQ